MIRYNFSASFLALGCALIVGTSTAHADVSEPEIHFYPAKQWNALSSPVTLAGATVQKCTITNEFNNGFIVQLSGSHKWVEALQIDFRQDAFSAGEDYDVALSVPGLKNKTLSGKAENGNLLTIGLRGQKDMYQAMRDSAVFDLKIDDNEFRFYMVGFAESAKGFERCMAGGDIEMPKNDMKQADAPTTPTFNEAIAYEQAEKSGVPIEEVLPPVLEPEIAEVEAIVDAVEEETAEVPLALQVAKEKTGSRKRLSETLAAEINRNPDIAAADSTANVPSMAEIKEAAKEAPQEIIPPAPEPVEEIAATEPEVVPAPVIEEKAPEIVEPKAAPEQAAPRQVAVADPLSGRSGLVLPPNFDKRPDLPPPPNLEASVTEDVIEDVVIPESVEAELEEITEDIAMAKIKKPLDVPVEEVEVAPVVTPEPAATVTPEPSTQTPAVEALLEQPEGVKMPETLKPKITKKTGKIEADFTDKYVEPETIEPAANQVQAVTAVPVTPAPVVAKSDPEMARLVSELQKKVRDLEQENNALSADLEDTISDTRQEQLSIANENWNLERATQQFNEAERQLKRLGQQLQQERTACSVEKQELEAMLFDPSLTADAQTAKLAQLRRELADTKEQLRAALAGR